MMRMFSDTHFALPKITNIIKNKTFSNREIALNCVERKTSGSQWVPNRVAKVVKAEHFAKELS